ncbi:MAG: phage tail tape measure C-terminal domain-containing protein [Reyranellaceae bacterium]
MADFDIVIKGEDKSAAAFASMQRSVEAATKQLEGMQSPTTKLIGQLKDLAIVSGTLWAAKQVVDWGRETAKAAADVEELGRKLGFTSDQIEAMQKNAKATGQTFDQNVAYFRNNREELDKMTAKMREQGQIMSGETRKGFADVNGEMERFGRTIGVVREEFKGGTIDTATSKVAKMIRDMGDSLAYFEVYKGTIKSVRELMAIFTGAGGLVGVDAEQRATERIDELRAKAVEATVALQKAQAERKNLESQPQVNNPFARQRDAIMGGESGPLVAARQREAEAKAISDRANSQLADAEKAFDKAKEIQDKAKDPPKVVTPTTTTTGGGGGAPARDRIGENIRMVSEQADAALGAYNRLRAIADKPLPLDELEREALLEQKIADAMATASKYAKDDPRLPQLEQQIRLRETYNAQSEKIMADLKFADQAQRQYGDGQLQLMQTQAQLNDAVATGRLTQDAATVAMIEAARAAEDLRLKNIGLKGGTEGFVAGWQNAANQYARANNAFAQGGQVFQGVMSLMDQAVSQFVQNGKVNFNQLLAGFLQMIVQMELRAAASSIWGAITGGGASGGGGILNMIVGMFGGGGGGVTAAPVPGGGFSVAQSVAMAGFNGYATGGDPPVGMPSWVGENGPELFVPKEAGTIYNQGQLADMAGGVTVVQHMTFGSDVSRGTLMAWGERVKAETINALLLDRRQGGTSKRVFG